ncbi:MAG: Hsp20/alpha crystallin family protein [Acidobacteria bacterium]|nr:Hsp20/alpha crystallin family protein [Acidobacteriota bacterium]
MTLVRWEPSREFSAMQDRVNRVFNEFYRGADDDVMRRGMWVPAVDIYNKGKEEIVIKAELPDLSKDEIEITVENSTLTIKGEKKMDAAVTDDQYHRIERVYGTFSRTFSLPQTVDTEKVSADYRNGVLTITLQMKEEAKPKQIQVKVSA